MTILNTTFIVDPSITTKFIVWIKSAYEASAIKKGAVNPMLTRIVSDHFTDDSESYALHLMFPTIDDAKAWNDGVGDALRNIMTQRWGERAIAFNTYLEVIE